MLFWVLVHAACCIKCWCYYESIIAGKFIDGNLIVIIEVVETTTQKCNLGCPLLSVPFVTNEHTKLCILLGRVRHALIVNPDVFFFLILSYCASAAIIQDCISTNWVMFSRNGYKTRKQQLILVLWMLSLLVVIYYKSEG